MLEYANNGAVVFVKYLIYSTCPGCIAGRYLPNLDRSQLQGGTGNQIGSAVPAYFVDFIDKVEEIYNFQGFRIPHNHSKREDGGQEFAVGRKATRAVDCLLVNFTEIHYLGKEREKAGGSLVRWLGGAAAGGEKRVINWRSNTVVWPRSIQKKNGAETMHFNYDSFVHKSHTYN